MIGPYGSSCLTLMAPACNSPGRMGLNEEGDWVLCYCTVVGICRMFTDQASPETLQLLSSF